MQEDGSNPRLRLKIDIILINSITKLNIENIKNIKNIESIKNIEILRDGQRWKVKEAGI